MAGLAGLAIEKGIKVTGQDKAYYPPMSTQLQKIGIMENCTEEPIEELINSDSVIIGNSQSRGNKSVEYILSNNINYYSGPQWIKDNILKNKFVFAVSGTHGKTTTTSMLIKILSHCGYNPGFLVGGIYKEDEVSFKYSDSEYFIIEADEYDTSFFDKRSKFIHYNPNTLLINNLEFDHSDIFDNLEQIKKQFHFLIRSMPENTNIVYDINDRNVSSLLDMGCWSKKIVYKKIKTIPNIIGEHNLKNAGAAIAASETIGINKSDAILALENFKGVKRRLELVENKNFIIYDDFAHHPTEILASLTAVREKYPGKKIATFFELRSNSMIAGTHKDSLNDVFINTDFLYIYSKHSIDWYKESMNHKLYTDLDDIINEIIKNTKNVDIVILMSNGDTSYIINKLNSHE
ncbi:MAG: UDP-N-acetylmuramate:L-alanyl-gamma-D-glutamyl-meso-diaminopimelate ligase [Gammaproteobacteria bacterium]|jgi:UDP-N-acetylmuramate: L-alanyl-gamma-D-glutamyl-meso-diaminopimelate ligase|nr:UDP-N-acetylmuramate:L-alanyl-gamma-D-glutamyl-meso-diaminopimelate ligase [Gammaproteobacteria bacterium]